MTIDALDHVELFRWWHQYQAQMLNQEADLIRNTLLQGMFSIRRQLELACQTQPNAEAFGCESHLARLEELYMLLENLSNRLESTYLRDSLPLALQHVIEPWRERIHVKAVLPMSWEQEPVEHTRVLTSLAVHFLQQLVATTPQPQRCDISLKRLGDTKTLTFGSSYAELLSLSSVAKISQALIPFLETFRLLTQGTYDENSQPQSLTWVLRWTTQTSDSAL
ncbi:MAG: hypothetical protein AAFY20_17585 [Cyanobacteria bacterium J06639_14]